MELAYDGAQAQLISFQCHPFGAFYLQSDPAEICAWAGDDTLYKAAIFARDDQVNAGI